MGKTNIAIWEYITEDTGGRKTKQNKHYTTKQNTDNYGEDNTELKYLCPFVII
jgi:hypothetical protein